MTKQQMILKLNEMALAYASKGRTTESKNALDVANDLATTTIENINGIEMFSKAYQMQFVNLGALGIAILKNKIKNQKNFDFNYHTEMVLNMGGYEYQLGALINNKPATLYDNQTETLDKVIYYVNTQTTKGIYYINAMEHLGERMTAVNIVKSAYRVRAL